MTTNTIRETVTQILVDELGIKANEVNDKARLVDDLGCDNIAIVDIVLQVEADFNINIDNDTMDEMKTMEDLINAIQEKTK